MPSILSLTADNAKKFFLRGTSYFNGDLPSYFSFDALLLAISDTIKSNKASDFFFNGLNPKNYPDVNYKFITNKDGNLDWRQLCLIHPVLYVDLVNLICEKNNWDFLKQRFANFQANEHVYCASIPVYSKTQKKSQKASQVSNWLSKVEQESIKQSLDYEFLFLTDIANFYPSIYTHSISWALHSKDVAKAHQAPKELLGNRIDSSLQRMSYGQTNGVPQGSILMDFIAEILLGYADSLLVHKIKNTLGDIDYKIIRYRDDYRIFVKEQNIGEYILRFLSEVLQDLGLKLNPQKTLDSRNIIEKSIKLEKFGTSLKSFKTTQDELLYIYKQSLLNPNTGRLNKLLADFLEKNPIKRKDNKPVLLSIVTNIAFNNPRTYAQSAAIISSLIDSMGCDFTRKIKYIIKIREKFLGKPNSSSMNIWLQRITYPFAPKMEYEDPLCEIVSGIRQTLWNSDWLSPKLQEILINTSIVDKTILEQITPVIPAAEVNLFCPYK